MLKLEMRRESMHCRRTRDGAHFARGRRRSRGEARGSRQGNSEHASLFSVGGQGRVLTWSCGDS
jgi:hypothetical protein